MKRGKGVGRVSPRESCRPSGMASTTWTVRMPAELKQKIVDTIAQTGLSPQDFITELMQTYELKKTQEIMPEIKSDIEELQNLTRRINAIFVNTAERLKIQRDTMYHELEKKLLERETIIEEQKGQISKLEKKIQELERANAALEAAKHEAEKKLEDLQEANIVLKSLVREYEAKNASLQEEIKQLNIHREENQTLRSELARVTEENKEYAAKVEKLTAEVQRLEQDKKTELEKLKLERDRAMFIMRNEYEKKINMLLEQKLEEYLKESSEKR